MLSVVSIDSVREELCLPSVGMKGVDHHHRLARV